MDSLFGEDEGDKLVQTLQSVPGWPADDQKDRSLVLMLQRQYPRLDLADEITKWGAWMLSHESKKKVNHRARVTQWCSNAVKFDRRPRTHRGAGAAGPSRSGGAPSPASAFTGGGGRGSW